MAGEKYRKTRAMTNVGMSSAGDTVNSEASAAEGFTLAHPGASPHPGPHFRRVDVKRCDTVWEYGGIRDHAKVTLPDTT